MRTVKATLLVLLLAGMFVSLACGILDLSLGQPPGAPDMLSAGTAVLSAGLLLLGEAVGKGGSSARWRRSDVTVGRLSSLAFGISACALGVVFLGYDLLAERVRFWLGVVFAATFPLALIGQKLDGFLARRAGA